MSVILLFKKMTLTYMRCRISGGEFCPKNTTFQAVQQKMVATNACQALEKNTIAKCSKFMDSVLSTSTDTGFLPINHDIQCFNMISSIQTGLNTLLSSNSISTWIRSDTNGWSLDMPFLPGAQMQADTCSVWDIWGAQMGVFQNLLHDLQPWK